MLGQVTISLPRWVGGGFHGQHHVKNVPVSIHLCKLHEGFHGNDGILKKKKKKNRCTLKWSVEWKKKHRHFSLQMFPAVEGQDIIVYNAGFRRRDFWFCKVYMTAVLFEIYWMVLLARVCFLIQILIFFLYLEIPPSCTIPLLQNVKRGSYNFTRLVWPRIGPKCTAVPNELSTLMYTENETLFQNTWKK